MATSSRSSEAYCLCSICMGKFEDPKILSCGHTFCQSCLEQLTGQEKWRRNTFLCPQCRSKITLPPSRRVQDFPTNFAIIGAIDRNCDGYSLHGFCLEHKKYEDLFCSTCRICICSDCFARHHKQTDHDVTSMTDQAISAVEQLQSIEKWYRESQCKRLLDRISVVERNNEDNALIVTQRIQKVQEQMVEEINRQAEQLQRTIQIVTSDNKQGLKEMKKVIKKKYAKDLEKAGECTALMDQISKSGISRGRFEKFVFLCSAQEKWDISGDNSNVTLSDSDDEATDEDDIHTGGEETDDDENSDVQVDDTALMYRQQSEDVEAVGVNVVSMEDKKSDNDHLGIHDYQHDALSIYQPEQFSNDIEFCENPENGAIAIGSLKSSNDKLAKRADEDTQSRTMSLQLGGINNHVYNWLTWACGKLVLPFLSAMVEEAITV